MKHIKAGVNIDKPAISIKKFVILWAQRFIYCIFIC